jgi:hypothetical protein
VSISAIDQPGRAHIQRDLKHLVRDVRQDVKAEVSELRDAGATEKVADVRGAYFDFRDQVQSAFQDAGRGGAFDATQVPEGLRQALVSFTEALRAINGPLKTPDGETSDQPAEAPVIAPGALLDTTA